jgi:O-antigen ligase
VGVTFSGMLAWMMLCAPFSYWKGGSFTYILWYIQFFLVLMLVFAVASRTPKDIVKLCGVLAFSCLFHLVVNGRETSGRYALSGTFGNSDDVALLAGFAIPFWVLATGRFRNPIVRYSLIAGGCGYLLLLIGRTATRAAIPALIAMLVVYVVRTSGAGKAAIVAFSIIGTLGAVVMLPRSTVERFASIADVFDLSSHSVQDFGNQTEAQGSLIGRKELVNDAINAALSHPVFGIGPGQFVEYRFNEVRNPDGTTKPYLPSHNTYLEIASESGFPGLLLYLAFLICIFSAIRRSRKMNQVRTSPDESISQICLCAEAALVYFAVCAAFMTCDRHPHQFVLAGIAIALAKITTAQDKEEPEEDKQEPGIVARQRVAAPPPARRHARRPVPAPVRTSLSPS